MLFVIGAAHAQDEARLLALQEHGTHVDQRLGWDVLHLGISIYLRKNRRGDDQITRHVDRLISVGALLKTARQGFNRAGPAE